MHVTKRTIKCPYYSIVRLKRQPLKTRSGGLFKGIVGAVVIFDHGLKFGIIFLGSDYPAHEKSIASKKSLLLSNN